MRVDYDEERRWIVMERGALAIACNLGNEAADVPVTGEVVLAWEVPAVAPKIDHAARPFVCDPSPCTQSR